jgi:tetratricopeptide (TPR) repeat protein
MSKENSPKEMAASGEAPSVRTPSAKSAASAKGGVPAAPVLPTKVAPLFRPVDWITFAVTTLLVFVGYYMTLAPDLTLEDCGELAVASFYAGVPHPPGYPVWTVYTWLFTVLLPVSNIAFRVAVASAFAGAVGCGLIGLMVSRGSSLIIEGMEEVKNFDRKWENIFCFAAGYVAALLMGFNGFMWSQSVIVEVYSFSVFSLTAVLCFLLRWMYAPQQNRYLFLAFLTFGLCTTTHQTLILAAVGLEVAIAAANPRLGRDLLFINSICYLVGLFGKSRGWIPSFVNPADPSKPAMLFLIFNFVGFFSMVACGWLIVQTKKLMTEWKPVLISALLFVVGSAAYLYMPVTSMSNPPLNWGYPRTIEGFKHSLSRGQYERTNPTDVVNDPARFLQQLWSYFEGAVEEFNLVYLAIGLLPFLYIGIRVWREGARKELFYILAASTGTLLCFAGMVAAQGFKAKELLSPLATFAGLFLLADCLLLMLLTYRYMRKVERAWMVGSFAMYICLALLLLIMLNMSPDRQSKELCRVFFTSSHVFICMAVGYGLTLLAASVATHYDKLRLPILGGCAVASGIALYVVAVTFSDTSTFDASVKSFLFDIAPSKDPLIRFTSLFALGLGLFAAAVFAVFRSRGPLAALALVFLLLPAKPILSHWSDNEQRGHLFGYWFCHDMFTPPFKNEQGKWSYDPEERKRMIAKGANIYPEMDRDTVLFGGTDPGRFNPTYMIFCESFIPGSKKPHDPLFDRRDVYLITQNALADGTYLSYIRAHYNRSAQKDPGFFQEAFRSPQEVDRNVYTNGLASLFTPVDRAFLTLGDNVEKDRRAGTSFFKPDHFTDLAGFRAKLGQAGTPLTKHLKQNLSPETQALLAGGDEQSLRTRLAKELNALLEKELLFQAARFQGVVLSDRTRKFIAQNPESHTRIRLNRLCLEEAFPKEIAVSLGGVYPDREILTPTQADSQKAFSEYMEDAQRRLSAGQLRPGEDVRVDGGRVQVSGQVAVMAINALLTKVIFDKNPDHAFFVEESFPLDWMYPHLTPFGVIMKINRNPLPELTPEILERDHKFWSEFSERLIGNWITYDTPVSNICKFAENVYLHRDYTGFKGDPKFIRDDNAQKAFSKLRSSIGGVYNWRVNTAPNATVRQRMIQEAEFSFKQALAYCPFSPEAVFRYVNLILGLNQPERIDDAILIALTCKKLDPYNAQVDDLVNRLRMIKNDSANMMRSRGQIGEMEAAFRADPSNAQKAFNLAQAQMGMQNTNAAMNTLEVLLQQPKVEAPTVVAIAKAFVDFQQIPRLERALLRLTAISPESPEAWYDLAGVQALMGRGTNSISSLGRALVLGQQRMQKDPKANNLRDSVLRDERFRSLRNLPEFQKLINTP